MSQLMSIREKELHDQVSALKAELMAIRYALKTPTAAQAPEVGVPTLIECDLAMLVQRLIRALAKISPDSDLIESSHDYLQRKGLQGSPLRTLGERLRDANAPKPFPSKKGI